MEGRKNISFEILNNFPKANWSSRFQTSCHGLSHKAQFFNKEFWKNSRRFLPNRLTFLVFWQLPVLS
jgi:hypothetical protein